MPRKCSRCGSADAEVNLPYARLSLCRDCFLEYYAGRIKRTVEKYRMFHGDETVGVAVSGGKDSAALLHGLRRAFPNQKIVALHVNLGIPEYSNRCQEEAERLADLVGVDIHVLDLKREENVSLSDFRRTVFKKKICSVCGTIKRHSFEEIARRAGVKVLATGHNMDDILSFMLNSFFTKQWTQLIRLKPVLPPLFSWMTRKVKPLIRTSGRENLLYCLYAGVPFTEIECPYSRGVKTKEKLKILETLSMNNPNFKYQALDAFLEISKILEEKIRLQEATPCVKCGFPSLDGVCAYCKRMAYVKGALSNG